APVEDATDVRPLIDVLVLLEHTVAPARDGNSGLVHHPRNVALRQPIQIDVPHFRPMLERTGRYAVIAGQRIRVRADVCRTLHVVVAAEDVGAAARDTDVAECQLYDAGGTHHGVADGVLRLAHAPYQRRGPVLRHRFGRFIQRRLGHAAHTLHFRRRPGLQHFFAHLVHAVDARVDVFLVFPAVIEDVP